MSHPAVNNVAAGDVCMVVSDAAIVFAGEFHQHTCRLDSYLVVLSLQTLNCVAGLPNQRPAQDPTEGRRSWAISRAGT